MPKMDLFAKLSVTRSQIFVLRKKDIDLIEFKLTTDAVGAVSCHILKVLNNRPEYLPHNLVLDDKHLLSWLKTRFIPKNRRFVEKLISSIGFGDNELITLLTISFGLSLNDDYWVVPELQSTRNWRQHNLYDNEFSDTLALIAFTGYEEKVAGIASSPEFTTNGMLPKCWRRIDGKVYLFKGGTDGSANAGMEPYSEYYSAQVASVMELNFVGYDLVEWRDKLCSVCELFTSQDYYVCPNVGSTRGYVAIEYLTNTNGYSFRRANCRYVVI